MFDVKNFKVSQRTPADINDSRISEIEKNFRKEYKDDKFKLKNIKIEVIEDENPKLYKNRCVSFLHDGEVDKALEEIDKAIKYADIEDKKTYINYKINILYGQKDNIEVYKYLKENSTLIKASFKNDNSDIIPLIFNNIKDDSKIFELLEAFSDCNKFTISNDKSCSYIVLDSYIEEMYKFIKEKRRIVSIIEENINNYEEKIELFYHLISIDYSLELIYLDDEVENSNIRKLNEKIKLLKIRRVLSILNKEEKILIKEIKILLKSIEFDYIDIKYSQNNSEVLSTYLYMIYIKSSYIAMESNKYIKMKKYYEEATQYNKNLNCTNEIVKEYKNLEEAIKSFVHNFKNKFVISLGSVSIIIFIVLIFSTYFKDNMNNGNIEYNYDNSYDNSYDNYDDEPVDLYTSKDEFINYIDDNLYGNGEVYYNIYTNAYKEIYNANKEAEDIKSYGINAEVINEHGYNKVLVGRSNTLNEARSIRDEIEYLTGYHEIYILAVDNYIEELLDKFENGNNSQSLVSEIENKVYNEGYDYYQSRYEKLLNNIQTSSENDMENNDEYIIYDSDSRMLSKDELEKYTKNELAYIRNEIFARYGYIFKNKKYQSYFESKNWYNPDPSYKGMVEEMNMYERYNVKLIESLEGK